MIKRIAPKAKKPIAEVLEDKVVEKAIEAPAEKKARKKKEPTVVEIPEEKKIYRTYEDFDYSDLMLYAGIDNIVTSEVLTALWPALVKPQELLMPQKNGQPKKITAPGIIKSVVETEMLCHEFIINLEINGMLYDIQRNRAISQQMVQEVAEFDEKIFSAIGKRINLDSGTEVGKYLYEELGLEAPFKTKSGDDATDGAALLTLAGLNPLANQYTAPDPAKQFLADMAKRKDINSVHNTFIKTYVEDFVRTDGRIHPSYNLFGTSSFRITSDSPNLTQLPRPKHGYNVRECYTVDNGNVFIAFDFSSAEVKILGAICRDKNMLKAIAEGLDFHSFSASAMMGVPYEEYIHILEDDSHPLKKEYKRMRQVAKVLTFSILYGSSVNGIAMQLQLSKDEAERLVNMYFKAYPGVQDYINESHQMALLNQKVWTPFGQYKHEYVAQPAFKRTAAYNASLRNAQNVRIQSATSTLGLVTFAHLDQAIQKIDPRCKSICTVYDSVEFEVPQECAAKVIETAFYYMNEWPVEHFDWLDLPIGVEGEIGFNWGKVKEVKPGITQEAVNDMLMKMKA